MFIKQQNNAVNQQINPVNPSSGLEKTENKTPHSNELLIEAKTHETLEFRRPKETSAANIQMETVEPIDRAKSVEGKNNSKMNAFKHGMRAAEIVELKKQLAKSGEDLKQMYKMIMPICVE